MGRAMMWALYGLRSLWCVFYLDHALDSFPLFVLRCFFTLAVYNVVCDGDLIKMDLYRWMQAIPPGATYKLMEDILAQQGGRLLVDLLRRRLTSDVSNSLHFIPLPIASCDVLSFLHM